MVLDNDQSPLRRGLGQGFGLFGLRRRLCPPRRESGGITLAVVFDAAYTPTPAATGNSAVTYVMVSGAGRMVTVRSDSTVEARSTRTRDDSAKSNMHSIVDVSSNRVDSSKMRVKGLFVASLRMRACGAPT